MPDHIHTELPRTGTGEEKPVVAFLKSRVGIVTIILLAIAAFLLLQEHWIHALGFLPYLLILACPLMHIFMHGRHGHGGHSGHDHSSPTHAQEEERL